MSNSITLMAENLDVPMVDAKRPLKIHVTKGDGKKGLAKDPAQCALSKACRRQHRDVLGTFFFRSTVWLRFKNRLVRYAMPPSMMMEIKLFDRTGIFQPGEYQLSPIHPSRTRTGRKKRYANEKRKKASGSNVKRHYHIAVGVRKFA